MQYHTELKYELQIIRSINDNWYGVRVPDPDLRVLTAARIISRAAGNDAKDRMYVKVRGAIVLDHDASTVNVVALRLT